VATDWPTIHAERRALAVDLSGLTEEQWSTPSLLPRWSVLDVLAHMTVTAKTTPPGFFFRLAKSGFKFHQMADANIAEERRGGAAATLADFRAQESATKHPPGPGETWLGETIVHSEDIRRPLGIAHTYPSDALTSIANFYKGSDLLIGSKSRIAGLTLRASDVDWSTGEGPEVSGPLLSLVLAMTGRKDALRDLSGEGMPLLESRDFS